MSRYPVVLLALAGAFCASGASAQTQATARVRFEIPALLELRTVSLGGTDVATASYTEVRGAVVLSVTANCPWRLVARWGGSPEAVQVRVASPSGASDGTFRPLRSGAAVASGGRGRAQLIIDYRIPSGAAAAPVEYKLELAGG